MTWSHFPYFALPAVSCLIVGAWCSYRERRRPTFALTALGIFIFAAYIAGMWVSLERPPLRTMGETRLWYSFFMPVAGLITWSRWRYRWILSFSTVMALVFVCINLFKPEIHSTTLMPALQSPWFAPHVIVYMFCYALFGAATCVAIFLLCKGEIAYALDETVQAISDELAQSISNETNQSSSSIAAQSISNEFAQSKSSIAAQPKHRETQLQMIDNLVNVGLSFMTIGMLFGALWAKEAWGTYWTWDPKETWAAITWLCYLVYIHARLHRPAPARDRFCLWFLIFSFVCLQMCWWGINYLPSAQGKSVHTYNIN